MTSVLREFPLPYVVLSEGRRCGSPSAVHEPSPAGPPYRASHDQIVGLRVAFADVAVRDRVKQAGGA